MNNRLTRKLCAAIVGGSMLASFATLAIDSAGDGDSGGDGYPNDYYNMHRSSEIDALALAPKTGVQSARFSQLKRVNRSFGNGTAAGDIFENPNLGLTWAHTSFDDDAANIDGDVDALTLSISGNHGDNIVGLGFTGEKLDATGGIDVDTFTADAFYGFSLSDNFTAGAMAVLSNVDPGGGDFSQYGAGPFIAGYLPLGDTFSVGATAAVMYLNGDTDDAWLIDVLVDLTGRFTDECGAAAYVGYTDAKNEGVPFDDYFTVGISLDWAPNDTVAFSAGYEKTVDHDDIDDDTLILSVNFGF